MRDPDILSFADILDLEKQIMPEPSEPKCQCVKCGQWFENAKKWKEHECEGK